MGLFFGSKNQASSKDFTEANLPHNRKEQFFDIVKIYYTKLFAIGAILCLFFVPTIVVIIIRDMALVNAANAYSSDLPTLEAMYANIKLIGASLLIVAFMVFSVALAATFKVFRRMIWGEPIFFKEDLITGLKENVVHFLINSLILGGFNLLRVYLELIIKKGTNNSFLSVLPIGVLLAIIVPIGFTFYFANTVYKNKFFSIINLSFNIFLRGFLSTLICCLTFYILFLMNLFTGSAMIAKYLIYFILSFIGFPFMILGYWENEIRLFDKLINANNFIKFYHKGIYYIPKQKKNKKE